MIIQCNKCQKKYKIDSEKVTEKGVKVTCQSCGNVLLVRKRAEDEPKKDVIPCGVCGQPATIRVESDNPLCNSCHDLEQEKAARFSAFTRDEEQPGMGDRELDLSHGKDTSFDSISGGDFAPTAYSTGALPGEGKEYVAPGTKPAAEMKDLKKGAASFEEVGGSSLDYLDKMFPPTPGQSTPKPDTRTPPPTQKPAPDKKPASAAPTPPGKTPPPSSTAPRGTPAPRPATREPTPSPIKPSGQPAGRPAGGATGVKDATPPPMRPVPRPDKPFEKTPAPTPGKKEPPKAEGVTLQPVEEGEQLLPISDMAEVISYEIPKDKSASQHTSILPFILSVLLLLSIGLYFFLRFLDLDHF